MTSDSRQDTDRQFKAVDSDGYDTVADLFDKYSQRFTSHLTAPMIELASLRPDDTVLDVGTGTGIVALEVARHLDGNGEVVAIDLSDGMLATAINRAEEMQLSARTRFLKMDAEFLKFDNASFDAVLSLYALHHFPNPEQVIREFHRVLKKGARVVIGVGSRPPLLSAGGMLAVVRKIASITRQATGRELVACASLDRLVQQYIPGNSVDEITRPTAAEHNSTGSIKHLLEAAGFVRVRSTWQGQYSIIESPEDFWQLQMTYSSLSRKRLGQANESVVSHIKSELIRQSEKVLARGGRLVYQSGAMIFSAAKS